MNRALLAMHGLSLTLLASNLATAGDGLYGEGHTPADTGGLILLILGVLALVSGARNLRDLRHKRLTPPRPTAHHDAHTTCKIATPTTGEEKPCTAPKA